MIPDLCDMCGCDLDACTYDYKVKIEVISGDIRQEDIHASGDIQQEIRDLISMAEKKTDAELMDDIYRRMEFRICPACQKKYLKDPIPRNFSQGASKE